MDKAFFDLWAPRALGLLRVVSAFLYVQHGTAKLFGVPYVAAMENLDLLSLIGVAGVLEVVGGALLIVGLFARAAAFVLSGEMAFAYFMAHAPQGHVLSPLLNQGESAVLFCFVFLYIAVAGAGAWSVDALRKRSKH